MSRLLLVRHGQASWGSPDYDRLSAVGRQQGRLLGSALAARGVRPDLLVSGSMRRHRQTAEAAVEAAQWDGEVVEDAAWDEFDHLSTLTGAGDFPEVAGESDEQRLARFSATIERWSRGEHDDDYRESFPAFQARITAALERTAARLGRGRTAVVFTSGGPVSWVAAVLVAGGPQVWSRLSRVVVNASVTAVLTGRSGSSLLSFNDHSHLEPFESGLVTYR